MNVRTASVACCAALVAACKSAPAPESAGAGSAPEPPRATPPSGPVAIATGQDRPSDVALHGPDVYYATATMIMKVARAGGSAKPVTSKRALPSALAVDASGAYFTEGNPQDGVVARVPLEGIGGGRVPTVLAGRQAGPVAIALDGTDVFWTTGESSGAVLRTSKTATAPGGKGDVVVKEKYVYGLAVDAANVWFTTFRERGSVRRAPKTGAATGKAVVVASDQNYPMRIAVDSAFVYWTNHDLPRTLHGAVMKAPVGGGPAVALATELDRPVGVAVDEGSVFFTAQGGKVGKTSKAGGKVTIVAADQGGPSGIAVDEASVYWANEEDGTVMRAPK